MKTSRLPNRRLQGAPKGAFKTAIDTGVAKYDEKRVIFAKSDISCTVRFWRETVIPSGAAGEQELLGKKILRSNF